MIAKFLAWLASLLTGPLLDKALDGWKAKLAADNDADKIAADLAAREIAVQQREAELQTQYRVASLGYWYEPEKLFAYIMVIYFAKIVLWDKVFGWGITDPISGDAGEWAGMIMAFYLGKRTFENVARIIRK